MTRTEHREKGAVHVSRPKPFVCILVYPVISGEDHHSRFRGDSDPVIRIGESVQFREMEHGSNKKQSSPTVDHRDVENMLSGLTSSTKQAGSYLTCDMVLLS
jgi:hypothetical protein